MVKRKKPAPAAKPPKPIRRWTIPEDAKMGQCRACLTEFFWVKTRQGNFCPINVDGIPHWHTCTEKSRFKKIKKEKHYKGSSFFKDEEDVPDA